MAVFCTNCGQENQDPGAHDLSTWSCGYCQHRALVRFPDPPHPELPPPPPQPVAKDASATIAGGALGAAIGGAIGGPPGAVVGALLGAMFGSGVEK
jgi:DNA-directed RNA polymerase subunit RPC12/RpoP